MDERKKALKRRTKGFASSVLRFYIDFAEEIADRIGHISLAQTHAALAYYHANREGIEADQAVEEAEADRLEQEYTAAHKAKTEKRKAEMENVSTISREAVF